MGKTRILKKLANKKMSTELQIRSLTSPACFQEFIPFKLDSADRSSRASQTHQSSDMCTQTLTFNDENPDNTPTLTWNLTEESEGLSPPALEGFSEMPIQEDNFTDYASHFPFRQPLTFEDTLTLEVNNSTNMSMSSGGQPGRLYAGDCSIPGDLGFTMEDDGFNFDRLLGLSLPPGEMPESKESPSFEVFDGNIYPYREDFALRTPAECEDYDFKFDMRERALPRSEMSEPNGGHKFEVFDGHVSSYGEDFAFRGLAEPEHFRMPIIDDIFAMDEGGLDGFFSTLDDSTNMSTGSAAAVLPSDESTTCSFDQQFEEYLKEISEAVPVISQLIQNTLDHSDLKSDPAATRSFRLRSIENLQHLSKWSPSDSSENRGTIISNDSGCNNAENEASTQDSGQAFETADSLPAHSCSPDAVRPYGCIACSRSFKTEHALAIHIKAHSRNVRFKCTVKLCARKCQSASELALHSATHARRRIFVCRFADCGRRFATADNHNHHVRTHIGERPYRCDHAGCTQAFALTMNLRNHKRAHVHTSYKPFVCGYVGCDKKYSKRSAYYKHKERHLDEKPFVCQICSMGYNMANLLRNHIKRVHKSRNRVVGI